MDIERQAVLTENVAAVLDPITSTLLDSRKLKTLIGQLENDYRFRNASKVRKYLNVHPQLVGFLLDSHEQLRRYFGAEPDFELEVVRDPEVEPPVDFLFVYICTSMDVDEALGRLEQFDENWYLDKYDEFGALVNFNLEIDELRLD